MKVEIENSTPLAVIYGSGDLESGLSRVLKKQHVRVLHLEKTEDALPILEKPAYIFFFAENDVPLASLKAQFEESLSSASRCGSKLILVLVSASESYEKTLNDEILKSSWPVTLAETRGKMDGPSGPLTEIAVSKLVRLAFSARTSSKQILMGKETVNHQRTDPDKVLSIQDVFNKINLVKRRKVFKPKKFIGHSALILAIFLIVFSLFLLILPSVKAIFNLKNAKDDLLSGRFAEAEMAANNAKNAFTSTKQIAIAIGPLSESYFDFLLLGETAADVVARAARIAPKADLLAKNLSNGDKADITSLTSTLHQELGPIKDDLGLIEAQTKNLKINNGYLSEIPVVRSAIDQADNFLTVLPDIVPPTGKKTYLLIFQNSAELRPTGGFIGSYGLVNIDSGKLTSWQIQDIYTADGQLRGQISPPDELLHFFNQQSWFMRDGNWSPDFPLTAKRLLWFLEKETGQQADGVIAVNLGAAQKILKTTGVLNLPDLSQTVSSDDFFQKAEYSAEVNFFAGSTQKKDFLGAVIKAMLTKITSDSDKNWPALGQALISALNEKDVMLFFNSDKAQSVVADSGWSGELGSKPNSFMFVDANLGLNKANFFIKRDIGVATIIDRSGNVENTVTVHYRNNSTSDVWPGGKYKNYLRFLVPNGSTVDGFDIGDTRQPVLSPVLTAVELAKINTDQFFVFQTNETNSFTSFGTLIEVPTQSDLTVTFRYHLPYRLPFTPITNFTFNYMKQPGSGADPLDVTIEYPKFLAPENADSLGNLLPLVFPQKLIYNSDTSIDRKFEVKFVNKV